MRPRVQRCIRDLVPSGEAVQRRTDGGYGAGSAPRACGRSPRGNEARAAERAVTREVGMLGSNAGFGVYPDSRLPTGPV